MAVNSELADAVAKSLGPIWVVHATGVQPVVSPIQTEDEKGGATISKTVPTAVEGPPGMPPIGAGATVPEKVAADQFNDAEATTESAIATSVVKKKSDTNRNGFVARIF